MIIARYEIMLSTKQYSQSKKLQSAAFVQLKDPETGDLQFTQKTVKKEQVDDEPVGFEVYSMHSSAYKRAVRKAHYLGLTNKEIENKKKIEARGDSGSALTDEDLDTLDSYDAKLEEKAIYICALVTKKLHHIQVDNESAEECGIKVDKDNKVIESVENYRALYAGFPDFSDQVAAALATKQNFTKA